METRFENHYVRVVRVVLRSGQRAPAYSRAGKGDGQDPARARCALQGTVQR